MGVVSNFKMLPSTFIGINELLDVITSHGTPSVVRLLSQ